MSDAHAAIAELDALLPRVEEAFQRFLDVAGQVTAEEFAWQPGRRSADLSAPGEEWGIKRILEHVANTNNFVHAVVVAKARNLGTLRCIAEADFHSLPEAIMTIRVSHRRVLNQVAGITADEFRRPVPHPPLDDLTVRDVLRMMADHYLEHAAQIEKAQEQYRTRVS